MTKIIDKISRTEINGRVRWVCVLGDDVSECLTDEQARDAARAGTDRRGLIDGLHAARAAESERTTSGRRAYATATYYVRDPGGPAEGAWWIVALSA